MSTIKVTSSYIKKLISQDEHLGMTKKVNHFEPYVSVWVITYQHAKYIRDCIESILMQKANFLYEIVIGEDQSTDGTREICIEYAQKHQDKIRLFLRNRKQTVIVDESGNFIKSLNGILTLYACRGKYIAMLEGDDYWTDPYKLQKQVDFLESHPDYGLVHTEYDEFIETENRVVKNVHKGRHNVISGMIFIDLLHVNFIATATVVCRKNLVIDALNSFASDFYKWKMGDYPLWLYISTRSKIMYLQDNTTVRRVLDESLSKSKNPLYIIDLMFARIEVINYFLNHFELDARIKVEVLTRYYESILWKAFKIMNCEYASTAYYSLLSLNPKANIKYHLYYWGTKNKLINKGVLILKNLYGKYFATK